MQAFSIVPAECIVGRRLGFYYELVATLLLPIGSLVVILLLAALVYSWELYQLRRQLAQGPGRASSMIRAVSRVDRDALDGADSPGRGSREKRQRGQRATAHHLRDTTLRAMLGRPQVWTLNIIWC